MSEKSLDVELQDVENENLENVINSKDNELKKIQYSKKIENSFSKFQNNVDYSNNSLKFSKNEFKNKDSKEETVVSSADIPSSSNSLNTINSKNASSLDLIERIDEAKKVILFIKKLEIVKQFLFFKRKKEKFA